MASAAIQSIERRIMADHPALGLLARLAHDVHSIASAYPEVAVELADPSLSSARYDSDEAVDWLCPNCGSKWRCPISDRTIRRVKHDCIDADETLTDEADSLAARVPELADRWDAAANHAAASAVPVTSKRTWSWRCPQHGETWSMSIRDARRAQPCDRCRREKIGRSSRERWASQKFDRTILDDPTLAAHWLTDENEVRPDAVSATDKTHSRWFSCSDCGAHTLKTPKAYSRFPRCRECAKKHRDKTAGHGIMAAAVRKRGRALADLDLFDPAVWADSNEYDLGEVGEGSDVPVDFRCVACHQEWTEPLQAFLRDAHCPYCYHDHLAGAEQTVFASPDEAPRQEPEEPTDLPTVAEQSRAFHEKNYSYKLHACNSIAAKSPDLARWFDEEKNGVSAGEVGYSLRSIDYWWTCPTCGESFRCTPYKVGRIIGGRKTTAHVCCDGEPAIRGVNTLDTLFPEITAEFTPPQRHRKLKPEFITPADDTMIWWKCSRCHELWPATPRDRTIWSVYRKKCPVCWPPRLARPKTGETVTSETDLPDMGAADLAMEPSVDGLLADPSGLRPSAGDAQPQRLPSHGDCLTTHVSRSRVGRGLELTGADVLEAPVSRRREGRLETGAGKHGEASEDRPDAGEPGEGSAGRADAGSVPASPSAGRSRPGYGDRGDASAVGTVEAHRHKPDGGAGRLATSSGGEDSLAEFIISVRPDLEDEIKAGRNDRGVLAGREIDILVPSLRLGFEFNGTFFHNELHVSRLKEMDKWLDAAAAGIDLVYVWEDDWTGTAGGDEAVRLRRTIAAMLRGDAEAVLREHVDDSASMILAGDGAGSGLVEVAVGNGSPEWWACKQLGWQLQRVDGPRAWALKTTRGAEPMLRSHVCAQREVAAGDPAYLSWDAGTSTWRRP